MILIKKIHSLEMIGDNVAADLTVINAETGEERNGHYFMALEKWARCLSLGRMDPPAESE